LLTNGANSPNLLITNRLQLVIGPQLETDQVSQSLFEKSSLDDMTHVISSEKENKGNDSKGFGGYWNLEQY
jgi:hypothetical protein